MVSRRISQAMGQLMSQLTVEDTFYVRIRNIECCERANSSHEKRRPRLDIDGIKVWLVEAVTDEGQVRDAEKQVNEMFSMIHGNSSWSRRSWRGRLYWGMHQWRYPRIDGWPGAIVIDLQTMLATRPRSIALDLAPTTPHGELRLQCKDRQRLTMGSKLPGF